ncbi:MAG TPA: hypothetical protein PK466_01575 [Thermotogota bacterium]|nr:hypothetical protein [Thermotogota bacterium]HPJ87897.1 hypothetical protein [Thermotogota bacterium]HPR94990.1 hypothetical protein [Thermotogota bacterium]
MKRQIVFTVFAVLLIMLALVGCMPVVEENPGNNNPVPPLSLTLEESQAYVYTTFTATVTTTDPDIDSIQLWKKREGDDQWVKVYGENWFSLNNNRHVFSVNVSQFETGTYTLRAQGLGDSAKSSEKQLVVLPVELIPEITVNVNGDNITNHSFVGATDTVTATFSVDVDFQTEKLKSIFDEMYWKFEFSGAQQLVKDGTVTPDTFASTKIAIEMATECTKYATLTIFATANNATYSNASRFNFTLDMKDPETRVSRYTISEDMDSAKLIIEASDTKSLDKASISFFANKGIQGAGWEQKDINWGTPSVIIGTGEKAITGTCEYSNAVLNGTVKNAVATITFNLTKLDGVTLEATAMFEDKADFGINHSSDANDSLFFDNIYHEIQQTNLNVPVFEDTYVLTAATNTAAFRFSFIDAFNNISTTSGNYSVLSSNNALLSVNTDFNEAPRTILDICTGYATKIVQDATVTIHAPAEPTEGEASLTITATDTNGNTKMAIVPVIIDTQYPLLASVDGHMADKQGAADDYINFAFRNQDANQGINFSTVRVIINNNENSFNQYTNNGVEVVQLNEPNAFRINFRDRDYALTEGGTVRLRIEVMDKYGNKGTAELEGNVSNP